MKWEEYAHGKTNCEDSLFLLGKLRDHFTVELLIEDHLWVAHNYKPDESGYCWLEFAFFEFNCIEVGLHENEAQLTMLMNGEGPTGSLKECRHTYWGKEGYIFYPNKENIIVAMEWLSKYYNLN